MNILSDKDQALEILRMYGLPIDSRNWWTRYPVRAAEEIYKMEHNTVAQMTVDGLKLIWVILIITDQGTKRTFYIETLEFPHCAPKVYGIDPVTKCDFKRHIHSGGNLCLYHPDEYSPNMSILDHRNLSASWSHCVEEYDRTGTWPADEYKH